MEEGKTPTAQEFIKKFYEENKFSSLKNNSEYLMIEFAKMHVKNYQNSLLNGFGHDLHIIFSKEDIINSYPLENIK